MNKISKKRVIGLKDIAREAGVAVPTVSLILNGRTNTFIADATRERVKAIAHRLNYRAKFSHKLIHGAQTHTAAIVITEEIHRADEHIRSLVLLLIEKLECLGYSSYVTTLVGVPAERIRDLIDRGTDAFIVIGVPEDGAALRQVFIENDVHYLGYNATLDRNIISDTPAGVEKIIRYFIAQGRDRFRLLIDDDRESYAPNSRFAGLTRVFPDMPEDELWERYVFPLARIPRDGMEDRFASGYATTRSLMEKAVDAAALFYFTDIYALGGAKWLVENGIAVGKDMLVAGFNNTEAVKYHPFPISSGDQDIDAVTDAIAENLFSDGPCGVTIVPNVVFR
ncbi:MAG: LacI family DNA-binding transcriptional regulator [Spirochaetota bacterium]